MQYAPLGRTGVTVSRICLGCMSYGDPAWRPWVLPEEQAEPFFRAAVEAGINFFDTADMYSNGVSEEITGNLLRKYAKLDQCVLATKLFFPLTDGPNTKGLSRKHVRQACEASLKRLGVDTIDLYQIHRYDTETPIEETLAALDILVKHGKVRYLGASSMGAWRMMKMLSTSERNGWAKFVTMQNHYNLLYREEEREMLPLCESEGVASIPWSPLARGLLARGKPKDQATTTRSGSDSYADSLYDQVGDDAVIAATREVAEARNVEPAEMALAWLLSRPAVAAPIVGATKLDHLTTAIRAVDLQLSPEEVAKLEAPYQPHPVKGHAA